MSRKRTYFGYTTMQQRQLLFETWMATGSVTKACRIARMSRGSFYHWKARFDEYGYAGLAQYESRAPRQPRRKSVAIETLVLLAHKDHSDWGKARIAEELNKANGRVPVVSPNTVRHILQRHGLWPERVEKKEVPE
jgi:transposase